jgi:cyclin B
LRVVCVKQEIKKPVRPVPISSEPEDCNIIDVEDYKSSNDFAVPMYVQHTEAMLEEIDRMVFEI